MKSTLRITPVLVALLSLSLCSYSSMSFARGFTYTAHDMDREYDHGYDDGYDDAMDDCDCPPWEYMYGWYFGVGAGYEGYQIKQYPRLLDDPIGKFNTHANGWTGRLYGGYGFNFNRYYLGLEANVGTSNASGSNWITNPGTNYNSNFSAGMSYGAALLPGVKLNSSGPLLYGRLGVGQTEFRVQDWSGATGSNSKSWQTGVTYGLGVDIPLYKNFSTRLEYDYIKYSSFNHTGSVGANNAPADNRGTIDLSYHLGR